MRLRRALLASVIVGAAVFGVAAAAFVALNIAPGRTGGPVQTVDPPPELVARGRYLAEAADCSACHTAPGGAPFAGGLAMQTAFGTIYATNITPDPDHGIGRWTADDFWRALHDGVARDGRHLYPAMPYTSYRGMTRADSDAIYAYLMRRRPAPVADRTTELSFPYDIRFGMAVWNTLFLTDGIPPASTGSSAAWQRGRYLVDALGHCGECHTPRGPLGEMDLSQPLSGAVLGRLAAPDITPAGLASRGWTAGALRGFLAGGIAAEGSAFGDMHPVVMLSSRHLTTEDLDAAVTYLLGDTPPDPARLPSVPDPATAGSPAADPRRATYVALCAGCHALDGSGIPNTVVALGGNSTLRSADPRNLVVAIFDGIAAQDFPGLAAMQAMPGFAGKLTDGDAAGLANYLRATWGGQPPDVTPAVAAGLR